MKKMICLTINQKEYEVAVEPNTTLANLLRDQLGLTGTKKGCEVEIAVHAPSFRMASR